MRKCGLGQRQGGGHLEYIPVFMSLLETTDPHHKTDSVHAKMLTRFTPPEHIPVFKSLLENEIEIEISIEIEIKIEIENADSVHSAGTHPRF